MTDYIYNYQVGASLPSDSPTYVSRQADEDLYNALIEGNFCYVFNCRQMGKSSLKVHTIRRLRAEKTACASVDLTRLSTEDMRPEKEYIETWYYSFIHEIISSLELNQDFDQASWWEENHHLDNILKLGKFIDDILLKSISQPIVIFIDEIDSVLNLPFRLDDFFVFLRSCYSRRSERADYNRLTFTLLGVATPADLIQDRLRTPFNIGLAIDLTGFKVHEIQSLIPGIESKATDPQTLMESILYWTGGQPFLTQKICSLVASSTDSAPFEQESEWIERLVKAKVIENWEIQDTPEHLKTIQNNLLSSIEQRTGRLLGLYQQIIENSEVAVNDSPEQIELRLSGLVVNQEGKLRVYNPIYASIFNKKWLNNAFQNFRPYSSSFNAWGKSNRNNKAFLLRGDELKSAQNWASGKSLSDQDYQFLAASLEYDASEILAKANRKATKLIGLGAIGFAATGVLTISILTSAKISLSKAEDARFQAENARFQAEDERKKAVTDKDDAVTILNHTNGVLQKKTEELSATQNNLEVIKEESLQRVMLANQEIKTANQIVQNLQTRVGVLSGKAGELENQVVISDTKIKQAEELISQTEERLAFTQAQQLAISASTIRDNKSTLSQLSQSVLLVVEALKRLPRGIRLLEPDHAIRQGLALMPKLTLDLKHNDSVSDVKFSPNGQYVLSASRDKSVFVKDLRNLQEFTLNFENPITSIEFNSTGNKVAIVSGTDVWIYNVQDWQKEVRLRHEGEVAKLTFSANSDYIATVSRDMDRGREYGWPRDYNPSGSSYAQSLPALSVQVWDGKTGGKLQSLKHIQEFTTSGVAFDPSSKYLSATTLDKKVQTWDIKTGKLVGSLLHDSDVYDIAISPDGQYLATATRDMAQVWDFNSGILKHQFRHPSLAKVLFSPNSGKLATVSGRIPPSTDSLASFLLVAEHRIHIWDIEIGREDATLNRGILTTAVTFSKDSRFLATATDDGIAQVWDLAPLESFFRTVEPKEVLRISHPMVINAVAFSPDGNSIATGSQDATARIWQKVSSHSSSQIANQPYNFVFSPNGQYFATVEKSESGQEQQHLVRIWRANDTREILSFTHQKEVKVLAFSPNNQYLITISDDKTVLLWDVKSRKRVIAFYLVDSNGPLSPEGAVDGMVDFSFSPDGGRLAIATNGLFKILDIRTGEFILEAENENRRASVSFSPNGNAFVTPIGNNAVIESEVILSDSRGDQPARLLNILPHPEKIDRVLFSPSDDSLHLATTSGTTGFIWDLRKNSYTKFQYPYPIKDFYFSPDGHYLITQTIYADNSLRYYNSPKDYTVYVWDIRDGKIISLKSAKPITATEVSPNSQYLSVAVDRTASIYDLQQQIQLTSTVQHVRNDPAERYGPRYGEEIWLPPGEDLDDFLSNPTGTFEEFNSRDAIQSISFSPDSQYLVTGSYDSTAKVWESATGREVARLEHIDSVNLVRFSPDGKYLVTTNSLPGSSIGYINRWAWQYQDLIEEACSRLHQNLSLEEWHEYLGADENYQKTCPNLPTPEGLEQANQSLNHIGLFSTSYIWNWFHYSLFARNQSEDN